MILLEAAAGTSRVYWFLTRATGAVALLLLTMSVVLGLLGTQRLSSARWPRYVIEAAHRDVSLLVLAVLAVHIVTTVLDSFAPISLTAAVIPFISSYRPVWLGLGALSFDLLLAIVITSLARRRLGYARWRLVHWLAYASWPVAVLHGLGTGSDTRLWWMLLLTAACVAVVAAAVTARLAQAGRTYRSVQIPGMAVCAAVVAGMAVFTFVGPLQRGWARRSGTPSRLLAQPAAHVSQVSVAPSAKVPTHSRPVQPFAADLRGKLTQSTTARGAIVNISVRLSGGTRGRLRVRLGGTPLADGGLSMTGSQVDLIVHGYPTVYAGRIEALQGSAFLARVRSAAGAALTLHGQLAIDPQTHAVTGHVRATR